MYSFTSKRFDVNDEFFDVNAVRPPTTTIRGQKLSTVVFIQANVSEFVRGLSNVCLCLLFASINFKADRPQRVLKFFSSEGN